MNNQNLVPFKKGDDPRREGNGRPKGRKSLANIIMELEDEEYDWSKIPTKGIELNQFFDKVGAPWRAIVMAATLQAINGDKDAREWLRKSGYGDKIDVTTKGKPIQQPVVVSVIKKRHVEPQTEATSSS